MTGYTQQVRRRLPTAAALTLALLAAGSALANDTKLIVPQLRPGDYQTLQSQRQRENFQQRQQLNRELDSLAIQRQPRIEVPVLKPRCRPQQYGTGC
ncbi:hypothetical protein [Mesorhizobium marinum]|uniref:Uncharacterized protein n=1 Tax=Mesorhizobium marinum TaxID=3228790 RepID=A0ABV3QWX0_9HYPH